MGVGHVHTYSEFVMPVRFDFNGYPVPGRFPRPQTIQIILQTLATKYLSLER